MSKRAKPTKCGSNIKYEYLKSGITKNKETQRDGLKTDPDDLKHFIWKSNWK